MDITPISVLAGGALTAWLAWVLVVAVPVVREWWKNR
jgi:hypothetical protein